MRIPSRPEFAVRVREEAFRRALQAGFPTPEAEDVALAVHEAVINAIEHGNQSDPTRVVAVTFVDDSSALVIEVRDEGTARDSEPSAGGPLPSAGAPRGRGIPLMRALMDDVQLFPERGRVTLRRRKPSSAGATDGG
ncbi:MAG TPA: ATP-binding protein [Armatimonadota bacterium]|nr:ATP-binding protein [Armatimonadota bacterium]HQK93393.1 ATP-binding protein [Armatimonadota bacterium]